MSAAWRKLRVSATVTIPKTELQRVFANLQATGLTLIGPTLRQNTIVLAEIAVYDLWAQLYEAPLYRMLDPRQWLLRDILAWAQRTAPRRSPRRRP